MPAEASGEVQPTRARKILATVVVIATVLCVWKIIDYRTQPPPPPNAISATPAPR
jgi:hypothetical protein